MAEKFLLIDGSSLIHRAFFALPPLTNRKGVNTGAVYGLCNMLLRLVTELRPQYVALAFDKSRKTFRSSLYSEYKAQRKPTPGELAEQFPLAMQLLDSMGFRVLELEDYEADDIIGTLAAHTPHEVDAIIVTGDRDELQLIDENVCVYFTKHGISDVQIFDEAEFAKNYEGLKPLQIIDLKGLMGDTSDNIPGVRGVGPKTALKLIGEYHSVENVLANIDKISGKSLKEKLTANKEMALLSKELATICKEAPVDTELKSYALGQLTMKSQALMQELEFRNLWERFASVMGAEESTEPMGLFGALADEVAEEPERIDVVTEALAANILNELTQEKKPVAVDYSVTGRIPQLSLAKLELYWQDKVYVFADSVLASPVIDAWLGAADALKIVCDGKELYKLCLCHKITLQGVVDDVALAAYLYEPGETAFDAMTLSTRYLSLACGCAAKNIAELAPVLQELLKTRSLVKLYEEIEMPLVPLLAGMEFCGIAVDAAMLQKVTEEIRTQVSTLESLAYKQAGGEFNLKSPKQLGVLLFEKLELPVIKKTKTGYSTDVSVLEELEGRHPLITTILEHRKYSKLLSTYLEGMQPLLNGTTGRIHTHFQQMVTVTGRLSSTEPNLQNIPTRTEVGKRMREMFVPGAGYELLMSCDYSQIELRVLAHISQDPLFLDSFAHNQDVHARTAAEVFHVPLAEVSSAMRSKAKAVNFGIVYGISDYGLSKQIGVSRAEAAEYIEQYLRRYEGVRVYMEKLMSLAQRQGYVETLFGRRRYLPDINSSNFNRRSFAERTAINTPIQGTAADIIKIAMIKVDKAMQDAGVKSRVLLQVHDELVLEVTEDEKDLVAGIIKNAMENAVTLDVPLIADVSCGRNWALTK